MCPSCCSCCLASLLHSPFSYLILECCRERLLEKGFSELQENKTWDLEKGQKYFLTRNDSTLIAFTVGPKFNKEQTGFKIIGTHTDSPVLKLAPHSKMAGRLDFTQAAI